MFSSRRSIIILLCSVLLCLVLCVHSENEGQCSPFVGHLVKRGELRSLISTENGRVSVARVTDGNETFLLHFITLDPNSLFLPVLLHQDMVFYIHTGSGKLSYTDDNKQETVDLRRGDVFRLESGTVFFIQSGLDDPGRQSLRIHAIFGDAGEDLRDPPPYGPYSSLRDLVLGFDNRTLQELFKVPEEVIGELRSGTQPEAIIHAIPSTKKHESKKGYEFIESVLINRGIFDANAAAGNKHKSRSDLYNFFDEKKDFENCNGWSTTVTKKKASVLKNSKYGLFMVNLTHGGMMGPHWNPTATEIAIVLEGRGMVRVVCPGLVTDRECRNSRFSVEAGDIFVVPKFHPMAQLAFDNETFVFVGFSTSVKKNHPQYLAGKASVLRTLDSHIAAMSFGINNTTYDRIVNQQGGSVILECLSCAEQEYSILSEEIEKEREEAREREAEEAQRKREEEEREREAARQREEEAARKREEEAAEKRREEEERERRRQQEEEAQKEEEREREAARQREEEAARKREEEAAERRREEEERERQRQQEEEAQKGHGGAGGGGQEQGPGEGGQPGVPGREGQPGGPGGEGQQGGPGGEGRQQGPGGEGQQGEEGKQGGPGGEGHQGGPGGERQQEGPGGEGQQGGPGGGEQEGGPGGGGQQGGPGGEGQQEGPGEGEEQGGPGGRGQQEGPGGGGQQGGQRPEGREEQPPQEEGSEAAAQREEEAARQQEEGGGGTGWARRIMKESS